MSLKDTVLFILKIILYTSIALVVLAAAFIIYLVDWDFFRGCSIDAHLYIIDGTKSICYDPDRGKIFADIENKDNRWNLLGFKVSVSGENDVKNQEIMESIARGESKRIIIDYASNYGKIRSISITPIINVSGNPKLCPMKDRITAIPNCTKS